MSLENKLLEKKIIEDNGQSILQISFNNLEIVDFQLNMINNHEDRGLSQVEKYVFNNDVHLKYNTYGYKTLDQYIKSKEIDIDTFRMIFKQIADIVQGCKDLLLESDNFILEKDCIFINEQDLSIKLINLPLIETYNKNINDKYIELASNIMTELMMSGKVKAGSAEFIINTNKLIIDKQVSISEFIEFINTYENKKDAQENQQDKAVSSNQLQVKNIEKIKPVEEISHRKNESKYVEAKTSKPQVSNMNNKAKTLPKSNKPQVTVEKVTKKEPKTVEKLRYKTSRVIGAIIVQPIIVGIILGMILMPGIEMMQICIGIVLMLILDGIIVKNLLDPAKKEKVKVLVKDTASKKVKTKSDTKAQKNSNKKNSNKKNSNNNDKNYKKQVSNFETQYLDDATEFLDDATGFLSEDAYLQNENGERVNLSDNFIIGRHAQLKEWIESKNIGRMHAKITKYEGQYFLEDLQSKNGTSLNGVKLNPNESLILNDGDIITLPDLTITFRMY